MEGGRLSLGFGPDYEWVGRISCHERPRSFELEMVEAMPDWLGTRVRFDLDEADGWRTQVCFAHIGWAEATEHFRVSSYCWAMYLRLLRRAVEQGEMVPYEQRLDV